MTSSTHVEKLLEQISGYVEESRALLNHGSVLELSGLDERIAHLCEEAQKLTSDDRSRYADKLELLFKELSSLGEDLALHRDAVAGEMKVGGAHRKAASAYRSTGHDLDKQGD
ncbi:MAG: hypothetical protein LW823_02000 [Rickettsiales bacterium]|jgi:hypothetical protein|nr:hypothetical protein [Rickettsiales bacterium]